MLIISFRFHLKTAFLGIDVTVAYSFIHMEKLYASSRLSLKGKKDQITGKASTGRSLHTCRAWPELTVKIKWCTVMLLLVTEPMHWQYVISTVLYTCFISDVIRSMIGTVIWIAIITTWVTIFQLYRADWGETADRISFIIPKGIPWRLSRAWHSLLTCEFVGVCHIVHRIALLTCIFTCREATCHDFETP